MPQVRNTIHTFENAWLQNLACRNDKLAAPIPQLYVKGTFTGDIWIALIETPKNPHRKCLSEKRS